MANQKELITRLARRYGVDPQAALAIASVEGGFHGSVGDNGTSFGPFQMHEGGALPRGRNAQWANSPAGINYAMRHIASVAHGLHGRQAVAAISSRFERPADIPGEISKAMSRYGGVSPSGGMNLSSASPGFSAGPGNASYSSVLQSLIQQIMQSNASMQQNYIPQQNPLAVRYGLNS